MMLSSLKGSAFRKGLQGVNKHCPSSKPAHSAVPRDLEILPQKLSPLSSKVGIPCQFQKRRPSIYQAPENFISSKMISKSFPIFFVLLIAIIISIFGQINAQRAHFIAEKAMGEANPNHPIRSLEGAVADRVENQLLGALELLQTYQEAEPFPAKFAEKKRNNKFEFIRFGRRRR